MIGYEQLRRLRRSPVGPYLNLPRRAVRVLPYALKPAMRAASWLFRSREDTNHTYAISAKSVRYLAHAIAVVTGCRPDEARGYIDEALGDEALRRHVVDAVRTGPDRSYSDARADFGRRLGWYAVARITRPAVVIETGVDKGLGSVLIAAALLRNGHGRYYGTDIDPSAGRLLSGPYAAVGEILYGDSLASLAAFDRPIDLFINDSDHSADYEAREYRAIAAKLAPGAIVLGDNVDYTDALVRWSEEAGRGFLCWMEDPVDHWFPGAGIGFSFTSAARRSER